MSAEPRRARVRALAKINLDLRVLHKRADGYHELRTIFQTISLGDTLDISFAPGRKSDIRLEANIDIPDNLVVRAAEAVLTAARVSGVAEFRLEKKVPMGSGLGGGSSDAAAVLLALPVLAGRSIEFDELIRIAERLGSDVPFFLLGGRAAGVGRGSELYPLPDVAPRLGVVVVSDVHVSTADAYAALGRGLTSDAQQNKIFSFLSNAWSTGVDGGANDFQQVVFGRFPEIAANRRRLSNLGASPAMMTGSGSAVFGLFRTQNEVSRAIRSLGEERTFPITLVSRARYQSMWWRSLREHMSEKLWPPRTRYAR